MRTLDRQGADKGTKDLYLCILYIGKRCLVRLVPSGYLLELALAQGCGGLGGRSPSLWISQDICFF